MSWDHYHAILTHKYQSSCETLRSSQQIATLTGISVRRKIQGLLTVIYVLCGIFLFSMMSSGELDKNTITRVGFLGVLSSVGAVISECYTSTRAQETKIESDGTSENDDDDDEEEMLVKEVSWLFVGICFSTSISFTILWLLYGVTLESKYWLLGDTALPLASTSFFIAFAMKPGRTDALYMRFIWFHFISFAILGEIFAAIGHFRLRFIGVGVFALARIPLWCSLFRQLLKLRASAAKLKVKELNEFLCQTVLVKGTSAMGPMVFFTFEAVACFLKQGTLENEGKCKNTTNAAVFLSVYLTCFTALSIFLKAVPKKVQNKTSWEYANIASLNLGGWQRVQTGFMTVTGFCSLYLLTALGTTGDENNWVGIAGTYSDVACAGSTSSPLALLTPILMQELPGWSPRHLQHS